jgi:general secretion pathway protein H
MPNQNAKGFTLLEILVVLVIIAVMAGLLVFSTHDSPERRLQREANALAALLNIATDEAVMQSREMGLVINDRGYHFVVFDPEAKKWLPLKKKPLADHLFPEAYTVQFQLDGEQIDDGTRALIDKFIERGAASGGIGGGDADISTESSDKPLLLMLSSGEMTAFSLTLQYQQFTFTLSSDGLNPVKVKVVSEQSG